MLHFIYFIYLLLVTIYLITKLSITYYFSACRENLTENRLSFPSAPRWVRHSYLSKRAKIDPLYLWVIKNPKEQHEDLSFGTLGEGERVHQEEQYGGLAS